MRARGRSLSRVIYDVAQVLESTDVPDDRLRRALELLRWAVPFDVGALLEAQPGAPRRLVVEPEQTPDGQAAIGVLLDGILAGLLADRQVGSAAARSGLAQGTLAVPIVSLGDVIGILFVRRAQGAYTERHLRSLAIVAGQLAAYLSLVRSHEKAHAYARDLDQARRAAIAADLAKDELLAVMSHKLRDPVTATLAWAHILTVARAEPAGPALAVAAIERNARSLAKLIDDIQDLPCVTSAELRLDLRANAPGRVLKAAIEGPRPPVDPQAPRSDSAADSAPGWLNLDPPQLGPVLSSVAASATQLSATGTPLAIRLAREGPAAEPRASAASESAPSRVLDGLLVLLVDDDADIREAFLWMLEHYGARVRTAGSMSEALATLDVARPDVLLCDLAMPGGSGYDLMREVAARDSTLPAAALTAFGELVNPQRARAAGFRMQLAKPIDAAELVAAVLELAGRQPAMRQIARP